MTWCRLLGLGSRELVSLVGGGGKSTLLFALGTELAATGKRVILTTTTKMGRDQALAAPSVCWSADTKCAVDALAGPGPVMLVTAGDDHKVTGPSPEVVDRLFAESDADYVIVEADGSRRRPLKAPASHEPVIPATTTTVVILTGIDAVGKSLALASHRVERAVALTGLPSEHILTAADCARVIAHPDGILRSCPPAARVVVAITKVGTTGQETAATEIAGLLRGNDRIADVVTIGPAP